MPNITKLKLQDDIEYTLSASILLDQEESTSTTSAPSSNYVKTRLDSINNDIYDTNQTIQNRLDNIEDRIFFNSATTTGHAKYSVLTNTVPHGTNTIVATLKINTTGLYYISLEYRIGEYSEGQISTRLDTASTIRYPVPAYADSVTFNAPTTINTVIHQDRMQRLAGNTTYNIFMWHNFGVTVNFDESINWVNIFLLGKFTSNTNSIVEEDTRV